MIVPVAALADEPTIDDGSDRSPHERVNNRVNLRAGVASTDTNGKPTICVDVRLVSNLGLETCGTGGGVLHDAEGTDMAHFRATYGFLHRPVGKMTAQLRGGLGFAELQVGLDRPGFAFGGPDRDRGAVAGPEASVSGQLLAPVVSGIDFVLTGTAGVAVFRRADELVVPKGNVQPFISIEAGFGW